MTDRHSYVTMPTTNIDQRVKRIYGLNPNDVQELQNVGIGGEDDLRYTEFVDLPGAIAIIKRRKLDMIGTFLATGGTLTATITSAEI